MTTSAMLPLDNPYVGPRTFNYADRQLYFGREREARTLLARVISARLLLFYAQSGAGKSSLINTLLIPQLREEEDFSVLPVGRVSGQLPADVAEVDNIFIFNLLASLDQSGSNPARLTHLTLTEFLAHLVTDDGLAWRYEPPPTVETLPAPLPAANEAATATRFALIIDQFEDIFTTHPERWQEREGFFCQLEAALAANPNLWVVLTLREDYVAALDPYAPLLFNRLRARFYMERMDVTAALAAIQEPAKVAGRPFAPRVAEALVQDLSCIKVVGQTSTQPGQYIEPVQLQVVCYQLWENLARKRPPVAGAISYDYITASDVQEAGNVDEALMHFYEDAVADVLCDPAVQQAGVNERTLRTWFSHELITETGIRNLLLRNEKTAHTGTLANVAVDHLAGRYLLHTELRAGGVWVELVHDRFVESIRQANQAWVAEQANPLTAVTKLWLDNSRDPARLLRGTPLEDAQAYARACPYLLTAEEQMLLEESVRRQGEEREHALRAVRNRRIIALVTLTVLLALVSLTAWALQVIELDPDNAAAYNGLCWWRSLTDQAKTVVTGACEQAVKLAPSIDVGSIRDSRGLARALTEDNAGALADFRAYVAWGEANSIPDELLNKRRTWIRQLEAGQNPFDEETLAQLRKE